MQKNKPITYDPAFTTIFGSEGAWQIFPHAAIQDVLVNHQIFSSEVMPKTDDNPYSRAMTVTDNPRHKQLRSLVSNFFTIKSIVKLEKKIRKIANDLLAAKLEDESMECVQDFATLLPIQVIAEMLGVPYSDRDQFKKWSIAFFNDPSESEEGAMSYFQSQNEMMQYFLLLIEERQKEPQDDLISQLLTSEVDGKRLSTDDLLGFCILLLLAGNETTTNLIGSAMLTFIEHPEVQEHLSMNFNDIPKAIEEVMRYRSPVQSTYRIAKEDTDFQGHSIKKGDLVVVWLGAANHDESVFPRSEQFDINRNNHSQMAFGYGIHHCLGAPLARLETKIAFETVFGQCKNIRLEENANLSIRQSHLVYALNDLPITFEKR